VAELDEWQGQSVMIAARAWSLCSDLAGVGIAMITTRTMRATPHREIPGIDVASSEDGAGWLAFLRGPVARGLSGVALVTSDDHAGLVNAIAAVLPGAAWQRCRAHYADLGIMPTWRRELLVTAV
jgi:putative transposase